MSSRRFDDPAGSQEPVFRFLADPRTHGLSEPVATRRHRRRRRVSGWSRRLQGQAGGYLPVHGSVDAGQAPPRLRGRDRCQPCFGAGHLPGGAADHAIRRDVRDRRAMATSSNGSPICGASTRMQRSIMSPRGARCRTRSIDKLTVAIRRSHARAPLQRRSAMRASARDLYRAERRRLRRAPRSLRRSDSPTASRRFAARSRRGAADPVATRGERFHPPLSRRSAPGQHRVARRRADLVRRDRILRRDRERRRALRSRLPADGSGGARPAPRRQSVVQPLSRARAARGDGGPGGSPTILEFACGDPGEGQGCGRGATGGREAGRGARAGARLFRVAQSSFFAMLRRGSSLSAGFPE